MYLQDLPFDEAPGGERRARDVAAAALRLASHGLGRLAERMACVPARADARTLTLEFHGDAAAPEGALYVNGELIGRVLGVSRL